MGGEDVVELFKHIICVGGEFVDLCGDMIVCGNEFFKGSCCVGDVGVNNVDVFIDVDDFFKFDIDISEVTCCDGVVRVLFSSNRGV